MKIEIQNNKDFWAGATFFGIGLGAMFIARHYPIGSSLRMGPGYFPISLSGILMLFGLIIMVRGLRSNYKIQGKWPIRALILLPFSIVIFGVVMELMGFVPGLITLVYTSAASGKEFKFKEVLLLAISLCLVSVAIFVWGLGMPYPLISIF